MVKQLRLVVLVEPWYCGIGSNRQEMDEMVKQLKIRCVTWYGRLRKESPGGGEFVLKLKYS